MRGVLTLTAGLIAGAVIGFGAPHVDFGIAVGARPAMPAGSVIQAVDRAHKGDRLDISVTRIGRQPLPPQKSPRIMDGCEPAASPLSSSAQVEARCAA